jgi:hypothetical protein
VQRGILRDSSCSSFFLLLFLPKIVMLNRHLVLKVYTMCHRVAAGAFLSRALALFAWKRGWPGASEVPQGPQICCCYSVSVEKHCFCCRTTRTGMNLKPRFLATL